MQYRAASLEASGGQKTGHPDPVSRLGCQQHLRWPAHCYTGHLAFHFALDIRFDLGREMR